ncbi:S-layer homology domain-containing protein [Cohnella sp. AR92]|uniref:S-layer homology domain-containing protein n=1 Tax=Cohnella sp. AR92 TaxID=648716 RepID=UPI001315AAA6|nr:S-layer homology domain-containing protein [Cohnella sp. AR92]
MTSRSWKVGLAFLIVWALLLPRLGQAEAATPQSMGLEARMVLDLTDGKNNSLPNSQVGGLASNGEIYLYVSYYGVLYSSEDGFNWKSVRMTGPSYKYFTDIARGLIWDGQQFVLLLGNRVLSSKDGIDWQNLTPAHPNPSKEYMFEDIVYANGQYVILAQDRNKNVSGFYVRGDNTIFVGSKLTELKKATKRNFVMSMNGERPLDHVTWNGKMYLAGGNGNAYSYDGKTWYGGGAGFYEYNLAWDGSRFWRADRDRIDSIDAKGMTSKSAYQLPTSSQSSLGLTSIGFNGRSYLATGKSKNGTNIVYSKDGAKWSQIQIGKETSDIHSILPTPYGFLLAGDRIWYVSDAKMNSPSAWAAPELQKARSLELVPNALNGFYQSTVTRQDFSMLTVKLYEALSGRWAEFPAKNPFTDTVNSYVLKASKLGLVKGQEGTKFKPASAMTRQDMAWVLYRTLQAAGLDLSSANSEWKADYADIGKIEPAAVEAMRYMIQEGILDVRSSNRLDPTGTATREEAIAMAVRMVERFKDKIETYKGPGSISQTLFVPQGAGSKSEVEVVQRAVNFDGRFIWSGEAIKLNGTNAVPLAEVVEPLGLLAKWDSIQHRLLLSKAASEPDFAAQPDTGISHTAVVAAQPKKATVDWYDMAYNDSNDKKSVIMYNDKLYVNLDWLAQMFGWKYDESQSLYKTPSLDYDELRTPGINTTYLYMDNNELQSSGFIPTTKVGDRYIIRRDGDWNGEAKLIGNAPSIFTLTPIPSGWMLTAVKPGFCEIWIKGQEDDFTTFLSVE